MYRMSKYIYLSFRLTSPESGEASGLSTRLPCLVNRPGVAGAVLQSPLLLIIN